MLDADGEPYFEKFVLVRLERADSLLTDQVLDVVGTIRLVRRRNLVYIH